MIIKEVKYVLLLLILFHSSTSSQEDLTEIKLQLKWRHAFQFAGYYTAIEKGYYKEVGIKVSLLEGNVNTKVYDEVLSKRSDFSISSSTIVTERVKGKPFVVLANIFQHSPEVLLTRADSKINSFHDLIGKKIMMNPETAIPIRSTLKKEGLNKSNLKILDSDHDLGNLINNKVEAMAAYSTDQPFLLLEQNIPYKILDPVAYGVDFYGDCLFTTEDFIENNSELTKNFLTATIKGWEYAMNNKEELIDIILNKYKSTSSRKRLFFEANAMQKLILPKYISVGHMNHGRWENIAKIFADLELIDEDYDLSGMLYNPNPKPDYKYYYIAGIISLFLIIIGIISTIILYRFNSKLQEEVKKQTWELKEAKDKAEKSEILKTEFLAQMSHEIRSPINTILSFATLIKEEVSSQSKDWDDLFESMGSAGQRIIRTIDLLLNMSEIQTGSYEINPRKINLYEEILRKIYAEYKVEADRKNLDFSFNCNLTETFIYADEYSISQVFANLIDNSIKYTEKGKIAVSCTKNDFEQIEVSIEDSGIGISEEYLPKLFTSFTQEEQGYTRTFEGNGLGLALVKNYCEMNNAEIQVNSEKGKGSIFIVKIPEAV